MQSPQKIVVFQFVFTIFLLVAKYDYNDTTLQKIIDQIKGSDQNEALDFALNGNYTKAGVVARTIRGQTYVAISLRVGRNL